jgi:hypothetical protein
LKALIQRFDEHGFSRQELQRLVEASDILVQIGNGTLTREMLTRKVRGVWRPKSVKEQIEVLRKVYPDLDSLYVFQLAWEQRNIPQEADGLFVIPKLTSVAKKLGVDDPFVSGYGRLLEMTILSHLADQRPFYNCRAGELTPDRVRVLASAAESIQLIER